MPTDLDSIFQAAIESYKQNAFQKAIEQFSEVIAQKPDAFPAFFNRALSFYALNQKDNCKRDLLVLYHNKQIRNQSVYQIFIQLAQQAGDVKEEEFWGKELERFQNRKPNKGKTIPTDLKIGKQTESDADGILKSISFYKSDTNFNDVIGMEETKTYLYRNVIAALTNPELFIKYKKRMSDGLILYGASGTGKTTIIRAMAGEAKANLISIKASMILSMYVGNSERNVSLLFSTARKHAPCIILLDEMDSLAGKRHSSSDTKGEGSALRQCVNELLQELDGLDKNPEGLFVIGSTNRPFDIDSAFRRSGRFSTCLYIKPPNLKEREALFKFYMKDKIKETINYKKLALLTYNYSQADIARLCDISLLEQVMYELKTKQERKLTTNDVVKTLKTQMKEGSLFQWFADARKELLGHEKTQIVNGKIIKSTESGVLDSNEKILYKDLIKDIINQTSPKAKLIGGIEKSIGNLL